MKILVTGSLGFLGKNLVVRLQELKSYEILQFCHGMTSANLKTLVDQADFIFHLAGVNRPKSEEEFGTGNTELTQTLVDLVKKNGRKIPVVYSSSIQSGNDSPYGVSKRLSEQAVLDLPKGQGFIFKLPNVFGKWSRPNYNSVVATFCYNTANDIPHKINNPESEIELIYIDDLMDAFLRLLTDFGEGTLSKKYFQNAAPTYSITIGELSKQITAFKASRSSLFTEDTGHGLTRALHATYLSFLRPEQFSYPLTKHEDPRGMFVEVLKTKSAGQFSFFTAFPGVIRGGHYHHTKAEKFLVMRGKALFRFRHILSQETYEVIVDGSKDLRVVETIPGWAHDITNIGEDKLVVMLWANEVFDFKKPDTIRHEVKE